MRSTIALIVAVLLSACVFGCATAGRSYDDSKIAMIEKGATTEAQLLEWFGPATSRTLAPDGSKTLQWRFSHGKNRAASPSGSLDVRLGADGKVNAYSASGKPH
jgi:hypothetical protein